MAEGYTLKVANSILSADPDHLGVRLGLACLKQDIAVSTVAKAVGVSRQTVYHWFTGARAPSDQHALAIEKLLLKL